MRIGIPTVELNKDPQFAALLASAPLTMWGAGGAILLALALQHRQKVPATERGDEKNSDERKLQAGVSSL